MCKLFFSGNMRRIYTLGIFLICGLLLISADDCESMYLEELQMSQAQAGYGQGSTAPTVSATPVVAAAPAAIEPAAADTSAASTAQQSNQGGADSATVAAPEAPSASTGADFLKTIIGKEWKLVELRLSGKSLFLDRNKLNSEGAGDYFTMTIDNSRLSGRAAPNRYTTAYQAGSNNSLTLLPVVTTLMATSHDPERLQEREYYQYLAGVNSWKSNQKTLELYTTDANKKEAVLVYSN
ncbi:MAG: META domain-containing protein [Spirochaetaceae bacterium]|nr:META domain-containing protein [Spirochaetaceae bacterium]